MLQHLSPQRASLRALSTFVLSLVLLAALAAPAGAQDVELVSDRFAFSPEVTYDASVPSPADYLGYELGEQFTLHADVVGYLKAVAAASDRVTMHEYARTYEGRPLHYLVITSPAHHANLEEIREANLRLASGDALSAQAADEIIEDHPVVVWLSYNVHGNEASSTEAAMQVAYRLAAGTDAETQGWLDDAVVILDPVINPDGRDRFVYWYRSMQSRMLNVDASDLEHDEPWPGGRTNHYWFDLNRDWVWMVHPESRGRIAAYQQWLPQVHIDYHEQGFNNNYFTMPGETPRNLNLPDEYDRWADAFGQADAAAFDRYGISYFTRESFDFFYPGYGSSYPSVMGGIGQLREQGGHSRAGRAVETSDGYVLTLRQRLFDHYLTSMAAMEVSTENREGLLRYFRTFFTDAADESDVAAYLLPDDGGEGFTYDVVDLLLRHGVRVERATQGFSVRQARDFWDGDAASRSFDAGTFVIPTDQPKHVYLNTIMQRQMAIEDSVMYDMATWSAPLAYNLQGAAYTTAAPSVQTEVVSATPAGPAGVVNADAGYAYVVDWGQRHAPKALAMLWKAGYRVRAVAKSFGDGTRTFERGSLVVLMGRNLEKRAGAAADMRRIAEAAGVQIVGYDSGRMVEGIDLASADSRFIEAPKVAMLVDEPVNSYTAGQIWFLFDQWTDLGITRLRTGSLGGVDLSEYDVLILPGMRGAAGVLDSAMVARLRAWVQAGGTLVATEGSASFLTKDESGLTDVAMAKEAQPEKKGEKADTLKPSFYTTYAAREDSSGLRRIPGSALQGHLDTTHPLAFGMPERVYSLKFDADALMPSDNLQTVGYYAREASDLLASGYASRQNLRKLSGKAFAAVRPMGRGEVVFLLDNTQYRMFWVGPARLLQNAVMLMPGY